MLFHVGLPERSAASQERDVTARLLDAVADGQQELTRVAAVLHEDIGQLLTVIGLQLDVLRLDFQAADPRLPGRTQEIQALLEEAVNKVRQLSYRLNPDVVQRSGLRFALDRLVGSYRETVGASVRLMTDSQIHVPLPAAVALYQIADNALSNAIRHSQAKRIEVVLRPGAGKVFLEVKDDGCGFDLPACIRRGLGLSWMSHAAARSGLSFEIRSAPGEGTFVQAV